MLFNTSKDAFFSIYDTGSIAYCWMPLLQRLNYIYCLYDSTLPKCFEYVGYLVGPE